MIMKLNEMLTTLNKFISYLANTTCPFTSSFEK
ncbi:hypothetical protein A2U01_0070766, partial [Trifolium medium]|nr:hypothetical protein [Trifolium medium]